MAFALIGLAYPTLAVSGASSGLAGTALLATPVSVYPFTIPGPVPDSLKIDRKTTPDQFTSGETVEVLLTLSGAGVGCFGIPGKPVDAMFVFDISTSAGMGPGSNWEKTVGITKALFANLAQPIYLNPTTSAGNSQVGIVSSRTGTLGPEPVLLQPMTTDYGLLSSQVDSLMPSGDTDLAAGLDLAAAELKKISSSNRAQAIFLMLHDNVALSEGTRVALDKLDTQKIPVYIVVNSLNIPAGQQISGTAAEGLAIKKVYYNPQPSDLRELFILASDGNPNQSAGAIQVMEMVSPSGQVTFSNVTGNGIVQGDQISWNLQGVESGGQVEIGYDLYILPAATGSIQISNDTKWLDCNGYPQTQTLNPPSSEVQVPSLSVGTPSAPAMFTQTPGLPISISVPFADWDIGIPFLMFLPWLPDWLWLLLLLLLLLFLLYWLFPRNKIPPKHEKPLKKITASSPVGIGGTSLVKTPDGNPVVADIDIENVFDKQGKKLKRQTSWIPNRRDICVSFSEGKKAQINVWLNEELPGRPEKEIYRMIATLIVDKKQDNLTGNIETKKIGNLQIQVCDLDDRRGLLDLVFRKIEKQAMQLGVQELVMENVSDDLWAQLKSLGFERGDDSKIFMRIP
jgi:hypothetical protein